MRAQNFMNAQIYKWLAVLLACGGLLSARLAGAAIPVVGVPLPGGFLGVQYVAGSGPDTAYVVVDFSGDPQLGNPNGTYAFAYHWNPAQTTPTAADALYSVVNTAGAHGSLGADVDPPFVSGGADPTANYFVTGFNYGADSDTPDLNAHSWFYFTGPYTSQSVSWMSPANYGISGIDFSIDPDNPVIHTLQNGDFVGFRVDTYDDQFNPVGGSPALPVTTLEKGDFNLDGHLDASDVLTMEKALADLSGYQNGDNSQQATLTDDELLDVGDVNGDGKINNADVQALLILLQNGGGSMESVPEPAAWMLASSAATCMLAFWRRGFVRRGRVSSSA
jgi:hypothetical protein